MWCTMFCDVFCRFLYKQKRYGEAIQYVKEALDMVDDPHLQALSEKIQSKIDAGL